MGKGPILSAAQEIAPRLVEIRRDIHRHPELGYQEERTASLGKAILEELGLEVRTGLARTGVAGLLRGSPAGKTIAIRADMDALPIHEQTVTSYSSRRKGAMHACGHDAHVAMCLGAAMLLCRRQEELAGNVKFILQPNEEVPPGGAGAMIADGVLSDPEVHAIIALHVDPTIPVGKIGVRSGPVMSSVDSLKMVVKGRGGHAALPHLSVDAIVVAAQVIQGLQVLVSRQTDPVEGKVISIGTIEGGHGRNIVADKVTMTGTVRTLNPALRAELPTMIERAVRGITEGMNASYSLDYSFGNPMVVNEAGITGLLKAAGEAIMGPASIVDAKPTLGGEDFAYFLQRVPGSIARIGVRNEEKGIIHPWHHPQFDIDEDALPLGAAVLAETALRYLSGSAH